ncbi:MAG: hypothetical protein ACN6OB_00585 [Chryseobacterium jejuense]|uniref:hypothetical protein n=1 Tax=Chryseobacterium jejuense TaxID=445960 RepID=UPI003D12CEDC
MKPYFLAILLLINLTACMKHPAKNMEIKYTSINDVYGNYVFNFKDSTDGIKRINDFAEKDILTSKKVADSINTKIAGLTKEEAAKYLSGQSLPTSASNIIFYNAPGEFSGEPKTDDILVEYELDEDNFKIKDLNIPNPKSKEEISAVAVSKTSQSGSITIKGNTVTLGTLKAIIRAIDEAGYHRNSDQYVYTVNGEKNQPLFSFIYEQKGKYFRLSF